MPMGRLDNGAAVGFVGNGGAAGRRDTHAGGNGGDAADR
ncbi:hypothetical protein I551_8848 [Mycobacterium ulcerans str. Harvey]|uniref:Uncharacterized protein n=1 Tax=Mycobacterium ulcerans str. Harvey TaxID=1299332 RepID=A0ABP3AS38_MYCUL|nr:hypothetical protein I551_8848 [Mycobacterium ulcerans str. Harvey]